MQEGKPIYNESLLTPEEWKERTKKYASSSNPKYPEVFECDFKWRFKMGSGLTVQEITVINKRLDYIKEQAGLAKEVEPVK